MTYAYDKAATAKLLADDETFALTLMTILLEAYGEDTFTEDSTVLFANLEEDFNCHLSEETENRINAAITCMTTDLFYTNINILTATALAFNDGSIGDMPAGVLEEINAPEVLWAIYEMGLINDDDMEDSTELFSPSVAEYIKKIISSEAYDMEEVPDDVDTVEEAMDTPYYQQYVNEKIRELSRQLLSLGCDRAVVETLLADNMLDS